MNHIINVTPRAVLRPRAVDLDGLASKRTFNEGGQCAFAYLAWAVHIEWPQNDGRQAVLRPMGQRQVLRCEFGYRVRPSCFAEAHDC